MTKPHDDIDTKIEQLLKDAFSEEVHASPAFRYGLYRQLRDDLRSQQRRANWWDRIGSVLVDSAAPKRTDSHHRPASLIPGLALVVILMLMAGSAVLAIRYAMAPKPTPTLEAPTVRVTEVGSPIPPTQPPSPSPIPTEEPQGHVEATVPQITAVSKQEESSPALPAGEPTDLPAPADTSVPTDALSPTSAPKPTDIPAPTAIPTQVQEPVIVPSPTPTESPTQMPPPATVCEVSRISGVVRVKVVISEAGTSELWPLGGVKIELKLDDGRLFGSTVTGVDGRYEFKDLPENVYYLSVTAPAGYKPATQSWGLNLSCAAINKDFVVEPE